MKHIKTILLFTSIFWVGQWALVWGLEKTLSNSTFRFSKIYYPNTVMNNDVLCLGNSRGVNSFYAPYIQRKHKIEAYNLSYNGLKMPLVNLFLKDYLEVHDQPQHVFIEVSNLFNEEKETDYSKFNLYSKKSTQLKAQIHLNNKTKSWVTQFFPLYRFNSELLYRNLFYLRKSDQKWINRYKISNALEQSVKDMPSFEKQINKKDIKSLKELVVLLESRQIKAHLFIAPYLPAYLLKFKNFESILTEIEAKLERPIIDISNLITDSKYFADRVHTNEQGAEIIADKLMEIITHK